MCERKKVLEELTLVDVLKTCNFKLCGLKASEQISKTSSFDNLFLLVHHHRL